jgi:hypothetical protein
VSFLFSRLSDGGYLAFAKKARLHKEAKAAEVMKRKAEAEAALLEKQKREVKHDEAHCALQWVLLVYLHMWHLVLVWSSIGDLHVYM